jgi:Lrp/AsnC family leucine-responsive transcriptional regulator
MTKQSKKVALDRIDAAILNALQEDGRISNQDLAERVHLSASACLRRVQGLEERGLITGYTVRLNEAALGYGATVIVQITLERQTEEFLDRFERSLCVHPEIMEAYLMSGSADYTLRVAVSGPAGYEALHKNVLSRLPGVSRIQSSFALRTVVRRPSLPVSVLSFEDP